MTDNEIPKVDILAQTSDIVSAYVSNNAISASDLPALLTSVYSQLEKLAESDGAEPRPDPAVPIKKSITKNHIICLEDGAKLKMLKRYLRTRFDMSPDQYRARWSLPADYPMVAPEYAQRRSDFAKKIGLGTGKSKK